MSQALNLKQNYTIQKNEEQKLQEIEEFYNFFYEEKENCSSEYKFPIFIRKKYWNFSKRKYVSTQYYINNFNDIKRELKSSHHDIYVSIFDKIPEYTDKKNAKNQVKNSRATSYFVIDIDSDYIINSNLATKITNYIYFNGKLNLPLPTAIIASGSGLHLYYKIKQININQGEKKEYFKKLYREAIKVAKETISKELKQYQKTLIKNRTLTVTEKATIESMRVDEALAGSPSQLIRLIGSQNYEVREEVKIIHFSKNIYHNLGDIITQYSPKYEIRKPHKNFKIEPESQFKKAQLRKNIFEIKPSGDIIKLNNGRLKDLKKLITIRKENDSLKGTRQKIMSQAAWCLINNQYNGEETNILEKLIIFGELIGDEFASRKYCTDKIKHIEQYHEKVKKLSNSTISKRLELNEEERKILPGLWVTERAGRTQKKKIKANKKEKCKELKIKGYKNTEIAKELEISMSTVKRRV